MGSLQNYVELTLTEESNQKHQLEKQQWAQQIDTQKQQIAEHITAIQTRDDTISIWERKYSDQTSCLKTAQANEKFHFERNQKLQESVKNLRSELTKVQTELADALHLTMTDHTMTDHTTTFPTLDELQKIRRQAKVKRRLKKWQPFFEKVEELLNDPALPEKLREDARKGFVCYHFEVEAFIPPGVGYEEKKNIVNFLPFKIPGNLSFEFYNNDYCLSFED